MPNMWDDLVRWLDDASKVISKEAGDLTQKGKLKLEIFELKRKLRDYFTELGTLVFDSVFTKKKSDWQKSKTVVSLIKKIRATQRSLKKREAEYKKIGKK